MTNKELHELAIAFAQVKLLNHQKNNEYPLSSDSEELHYFAKMYRFAQLNLEREYDELD